MTQAVCPICQSEKKVQFFTRENIPLLQNRVWPSREEARNAPVGTLSLVLCLTCEFVWNESYNPNPHYYDEHYDNGQTESSIFRQYTQGIASHVLKQVIDSKVDLVEIGCGQGEFLNLLAQDGGKKFNSLTGFDPAYRGPADNCNEKGVHIYKSYYGSRNSSISAPKPSIVVARHVIEHVPEPIQFLRSIRSNMLIKPTSRLFLELRDFTWVVQNRQIHDVYYEQCSLFTPAALNNALGHSGFELESIQSTFGGQYSWAEAIPFSIEDFDQVSKFEHSLPVTAIKRFGETQIELIQRISENLILRSQAARTVIWGASSKGVTFAILAELAGCKLHGAIDINSRKVGQFLPVTGLPVLSPETLSGGELVILMNSNYLSEVSDKLKSAGVSVNLLTLNDVWGR